MSFFDEIFLDNDPIKINNINELYDSLDAKSSHSSLRVIQQECIDILDSKLEENGIILKLSTGSGKTTIGLLYLKYYAQKYNEPVLFLVPTLQLAEQVISEATKLGIQSTLYSKGHRTASPEAMCGDEIIVSTYEKLFNGLSTFKTYGIQPCAIVFDDAHTGMDIIKKQFSIISSGEIYTALLSIIKESCKKHLGIQWLEFETDGKAFEVPYWIWQSNIEEISKLLNLHKDHKDLKFNYPLIKNELTFSRCIFSQANFEISPNILNIKNITPYYESKHKLFMSATFSDSDNFIRFLGLEKDIVQNMVAPTSDKGTGERMILVPSIISPDLDKNKVVNLCADLSKQTTVFVLTSSINQAKVWTDEGATFLNSENINEALFDLSSQMNKSGFYVMAQRFEGLDLADDLCRILVIDDIPFGESIIDNYDNECLGNITGFGGKNIFRLEQGMGRAVRSHVDYSVILLVGSDLSSFIAHKDCRTALSPETNCQLDLGIRVSKQIAKNQKDPIENIKKTIASCLSRDLAWKNGYQSEMKKVKKTEFSYDEKLLDLAYAERQFYENSYINQFYISKDLFNNTINSLSDSKYKGKMLENFARIVSFTDELESMQIQNKAIKLYPRAIRPLTVYPRKLFKEPTNSAINIEKIIKDYSNLEGILIHLQKMKSDFGFNEARSNKIEKNFKILGHFLGADSINPENEYKEGPDVCWYLDNNVYVIEIKHNQIESLHKKDSGQLSDSCEWARKNYPTMANIIPTTLTNVTFFDKDAHYPTGTVIINESRALELLDVVIKFYEHIISESKNTAKEITSELNHYGLDNNSIFQKYLKKFESIMKKK